MIAIAFTMGMVLSASGDECAKVAEKLQSMDMATKQELAELKEMNKKLAG